MPEASLAHWKERITYTESAEREFDRLAPEIQIAFLYLFPKFSRHPWRATADMDVAPLRDMPSRWRLKVKGGHRGIYRMIHGLPEFEMFETRGQICEHLRRYLASRS